MNRSEIAALLGAMAARDRRTIGKSEVEAWFTDIGDLDFPDARDAVNHHYRTSDAYLMPVHVRRIATELRRQRRELEREQQQQRAIEAYAATAGPLTDRSAEIRAFVGEIRGVLPEGDREALMPRTVAWEREHRHHQRQVEAVPNPAYDPAMQPVAEWNAGKAKAPAGEWWEDTDARERHAKTLLAEAGRLRPKSDPAELRLVTEEPA